MQIDKISRNELQIFPSGNVGFSLLDFLDLTETHGGREQLRGFLSNLSSDVEELNSRQELFRFLINHSENWQLLVAGREIFLLENYFKSNIASVRTSSAIDAFLFSRWHRIRHSNHFDCFTEGIQKFRLFVEQLSNLFSEKQKNELPLKLRVLQSRLRTVLKEMEVSGIAFPDGKKQYGIILRCDYFFRTSAAGRAIPQKLLAVYYELDAYISIAKTMKKHRFVFPEFTHTSSSNISFEGLYHPALPNPIANDVHFTPERHFMFLTGPNMAGKTTLMKSVGLAVYMAHLGMGLPVRAARLSVQKRLFVNIHNEDNLTHGESYFMNEVKRVTEAAQYICQDENCLLIFDELFKGTNVKDALDCSQLVIEKMSGHSKANVVFSSHLYELAPLVDLLPTVFFRQITVEFTDKQPHFTYKLKTGVSETRMGLLILKQSGIEKLLQSHAKTD